MSEYKEALQRYRDATRLMSADEARLRARVSSEPASVGYLRWLPAMAGVAAATFVWIQVDLGSAPAPVARAIEAPAAPEIVEVGPDVRLSAGGRGTVSGDEKNVQVRWVGGTLAVEVEPERGVNLDVRTEEALVSVVGTGFDVTRDALGTRVEVRHGKVRVTCEGAEPVLLTTGESRSCLPVSAAGMLGRARALQELGASLGEQADTVRMGLSLGPDGPVRTELEYLDLHVLLRQGDNDHALERAESILAGEDQLRRVEALQAAARLRVVRGDCEGAQPWMAELEARGALPQDDPSRAWCAKSGTPAAP